MQHEKYNCLVVDDEPIARKVISSYISQLPFLNLASEQINAINAIDYLRANPEVHIIFLDINMPNLSGLQLVKILQPDQPVIFTTAYSAHAVESYELNAADYLLKPFSFERFTKAVFKAIDIIRVKNKGITESRAEESKTIFIKSDGRNYPVLLDDILYCEARKNYTMVVLKNEQKLMPLIPLTKFESLLTEAGGSFLQVHRSFLIARNHIGAVSPNEVSIDKYQVPIGVQYKESFFKKIGMAF